MVSNLSNMKEQFALYIVSVLALLVFIKVLNLDLVSVHVVEVVEFNLPPDSSTPSTIDMIKIEKNNSELEILTNGSIRQLDTVSTRRVPPASCKLPIKGGYKSWKSKVVSTLNPVIPRNCTKLFSGDENEMNQTQRESAGWKNSLSDEDFLIRTTNCMWLRKHWTNNLYNSDFEKKFPIAFTFVVYDNPQQILRLIKLLYRPQNSYCIHYDVKSTPIFKQIFDNIAKCFDNVIIASHLENVIWGYYTLLEAQMNCLADLVKFRERQHSEDRKWNYVLNLCGKELPLVTHREIVSHLTPLQGSSSIITDKVPAESDERIWKRVLYKAVISNSGNKVISSLTKLQPIPYNLTYYKSSSYNILSHSFVNYLLFNKTAVEVYDFFKNCKTPEEHFFATLYMKPGVPGGYDAQLAKKQLYVESAHAMWTIPESPDYSECNGIAVHKVCVVGVGDLAQIDELSAKGKKYLFHNKYFSKYDHTVMDCMEERIVQRNRQEYEHNCGHI